MTPLNPPLTREQIEDLRGKYTSEDVSTPFMASKVNALCTMALASLSPSPQVEGLVAIKKAQAELSRLCEARWKGGEAWEKAWRWQIPANPQEDTDLILSAGLEAALSAYHSTVTPTGEVKL